MVKGQLQVPFGLVSGNVPYKYIVLRKGREKGEKDERLWERIVHAKPYKNRGLCIPNDRCHIGGTCNQLQFEKRVHVLNNYIISRMNYISKEEFRKKIIFQFTDEIQESTLKNSGGDI